MLRLLALGVEQLGALLTVNSIALVAQNDGPLFFAEHTLLLHHGVPDTQPKTHTQTQTR